MVEFVGVGEFNCEEPLKLDKLEFEVKGVGDVHVKDLTCRDLRGGFAGCG